MPASQKPRKKLGARPDLYPIECPSGAECLVRRPGVQGLIKMGLLDSFDALTGLVKIEHFDRVDGRVPAEVVDAIKEFAANAERVDAALDMIDKLVIGVVVRPKLQPVPYEMEEDGTTRKLDANGKPIPVADDDRDQDAAYIDWIDIDDKTFIMQYAIGGSSDLNAFRVERAELMGHVSNVQDVQLPA